MAGPVTHEVVVVGAGAAGLMAALFAQRGGAKVRLLERTADGGRKILISGGGRCNILPEKVQPERFVTDSSPNLLKRMLRSWPLKEQIAFFELELGMPLRLEDPHKYFPESNQARDVRDGLLNRFREAGGQVTFNATVTGLCATDDGWEIELDGGGRMQARAVILATGGLSVPLTGSDGIGLTLAKALGHTMHATYPALTPLTGDTYQHAALSGVSLNVSITAPGVRPKFQAEGGFLFTHRGYSGPTVLDASHLAVRSRMFGDGTQLLHVSWAPIDRATWEARLTSTTGKVRAVLGEHLPARVVEMLLKHCNIYVDTDVAQLRKWARSSLLTALTEFPLPWIGDEGYKKAEVTGGGVALEEVHLKTLESKRCPGLYLCGEILDAFGPIGGHNFLWAWSTGHAAGIAAAKAVTG